MRHLIFAVCCAGSFAAGVGVQRHLSGDELERLSYEIDLLGAQVETLLIRTGALEREASELRVRPQALNAHGL